MSCFMVINGSCSTNMCARQLSFNFSSMVWGGMAPSPPLWIRPCIINADRANSFMYTTGRVESGKMGLIQERLTHDQHLFVEERWSEAEGVRDGR